MPIVTVSRTHGSGGTTFARHLAERLGYGCFDSDTLKKAHPAAKDQLNALILDDDDHLSFFDRFEELLTNRSFYKTLLFANIYDLARKDNAVFIGMGAQVILAGLPNALHLRMERLLSERVRDIARLKNIPPDDALDLLEEMDSGKKAFMSHYFDRDANDAMLYHCVINASHVPLESAVDVAELLLERCITPRSSEAVQRTLTNKLLEKRAELLLFKLDMVHDFGRVIFEARDEGVLIAKGVIGGEEKKKTLLRALEKMNDVQKIEDHVKVGILSHLIF